LDRSKDHINQSKPGLDRFHHQVPNHIATDTACGYNIVHNFMIATAKAKDYSDPLTIQAGTLEGIRSITAVTRRYP